MSSQKPEMITGHEAVDKVSHIWSRKTGGIAPVEDIQLQEGVNSHNFVEFEEGVVKAPEEMKDNYYGVFEGNLLELFDSAFEEALDGIIDEQLQVMRERYERALGGFDAAVSEAEVDDLDGEQDAQYGGQIYRFKSEKSLRENISDEIVFDYGILDRIDPTAEPGNQTDSYINRLTRHEITHGLQRAMNPEFLNVWSETDSRDIERATTEGMARYEEEKGRDISNKAEIAAKEKPWMMPIYWRKNVAEDSATATDPYSYGELAAYFIENGHREDFAQKVANSGDSEEPSLAVQRSTLENAAEDMTRETLLNNPSKAELDYQIKKASLAQGNLFYGQVVESTKEMLVDDESLDYNRTEAMVEDLIDQMHSTLNEPAKDQLSEWYEASAVDQVYQEFRDQRLESAEELHRTVSEIEDQHLGYFD